MSKLRDKPLLPLPGLATLVVGAVGLAIGWTVWRSAEMRQQQEDLSRLKDALRDPEATVQERLQSIELWVDGGPASVRELLAELDNPSPQVRAAAATALARIRPIPEEAVAGVVRSLDDPAPDVRLAAVAGLRMWREHRVRDIQPYVPRLVRLIGDPAGHVRDDAFLMVAHSHADAAVRIELTELTKSRRATARRRAAHLIRNLKAWDESAPAAMRRLLQDPDGAVRDEAFRTLIASGSFTLEDVLTGLESDTEDVLALACWALEPFGEDAAIATGRLRELLQSGQGTVSALHALAAIGTSAQAAVPEVLQLLRGPDEDTFDNLASRRSLIRGSAFRCLARISNDESLIVATLRRGLLGLNRETSRFAGEALREFSRQHARDSVPALLEALADRDGADQVPLLTALGGLGPEAAVAVPAIVERLNSSTPYGRWTTVGYYAAQTLGEIGPAAADAMPALAAAAEAELRRDDPRWVHLFALYHIGVRSPAAERVLIRFIRQELAWLGRNTRPDREASQDESMSFDSRVHLMTNVVLALGSVGRGSEAAYQIVRDVLRELHDPEKGTAWNLARVYWALADLRVRPDETVTALLKAARREKRHPDADAENLSPMGPPNSLRITDDRVRLAAIRGLGLFPERADRSVPCLVELLQDEHRAVQTAAAVALGQFGERAREALPALQTLAAAPDAPVNLDHAAWPGWSDPSLDPIYELGRPSKLTPRDAALRSLAQIQGTHEPVAAPRPR